MAALEDDSKVMDVSKPGRGKPLATSRPVVAPVVKDAATDPSVTSNASDSGSAETLRPPSSGHKTIQPLSDDLKRDSSESTDEKEGATDSGATPAAGDDAASVDALVSTAETKKEAAKKAEEQAKKDAELQELIDSKKYVVPIKSAASGGSKKGLVIIGVLLTLFVTGYLLVDAGIVGLKVKLPLEFFKESAKVSSDAQTDAVVQREGGTELSINETKPDETGRAAEAMTLTPEARARDRDRKNELNNLQRKLETYFNDNDRYPAVLDMLMPQLSADELTDDQGTAYGYEGDSQTYVLSAVLEDKNDRDAESGVYKLYSVNQ